MNLDGLVWKKSSKCESNGCVEMAVRHSDNVDTEACVEVTFADDLWHVRQSNNRDVVLSFTPAEWDAFVAGVFAHDFD